MNLLKNETVRYLVAGAATVAVNVVVYDVSTLFFSVMSANTFAFLVATLFAFFTNSLFVFRVPCTLKRMAEFFSMRLVSLLVDAFGMICFLYIGVHDLVSKVIVNVIVIVVNYLFSKLFIFKKS